MEFIELYKYYPGIATLLGMVSQIILLKSIYQGSKVNLQARILTFIHWILLISLSAGAALRGQANWFWLAAQLAMLAIVGFQVDVIVIKKEFFPVSTKTTLQAIPFALLALAFGGLTGYLRSLDPKSFGWGWLLETLSCLIATGIVVLWVCLDSRAVWEKAKNYPKLFIVLGCIANLLVLFWWLRVFSLVEANHSLWLMENFGSGFNIIIGNLVFLIFGGIYFYSLIFRSKRI